MRSSGVDRGSLVRARRALAIALGGTAGIAAVTFGALAGVLNPGNATGEVLLITLAVLAMSGVGTILAIRIPANAVGWLLLVAALVLGLEFLALSYAEASRTFGAGSWPGTDVAAWFYGTCWPCRSGSWCSGSPSSSPTAA